MPGVSAPRLVRIRRSGEGLPVPGPAADSSADAGYESALERGVDFSAVFAETVGRNPDLVLELPDWDCPPRDLEETVWRALYEVADPEFPVSLVDLGLVYGMEVQAPGPAAGGAHVTVTITLTATACPCMEFIKWDIRERLLQESGVRAVTVNITWDPPWTTERITARGREALRRAGVAI
jgi:metal-sulfur cluster biosynthetic enzyme